MRRCVKVAIAGAGLAGTSLLAGCGGDSEKTATFLDPDPKATQYMEEYVDKAFQETGQYWVAQGISLAESTQYTIPQGAEIFNCGAEVITSGSEKVHYCEENNTIVLPVAAVNDIYKRMGSLAYGSLNFVIAHEFGHAAQKKTPSLLDTAPSNEEERGRFVELQATCLAGVAIGVLHPSGPITEAAHHYVRRTGEEEAYGTPAQQTGAYELGYDHSAGGVQACLLPAGTY